MKTGKTHWILMLAIATMVLLTQRAHALFTPELTTLSNNAAFFLTTLTNAEDQAQAKAVAGALKALSKPSTSVAQDYDLFVAAALKLGPFAFQPPFDESGSNTFVFFMSESGAQIGATAARIGALNDFVKTKKAASNNLAQAIAALNSAVTNPNPQLALLQGRQVFTKLAVANRLAGIGEEHSGFAADDLDNKTVTHTDSGGEGTVLLLPSGNFKLDGHSDPDGTFTYERTGLNSGVLILNHAGGDVTTVRLNFKTITSGKFTDRTESAGGDENSKGTFTIQ